MPENDFEKQVQQKMDELQFVPSDAVWHEVEKQIDGRKKRRLYFYGCLLFLFYWVAPHGCIFPHPEKMPSI